MKLLAKFIGAALVGALALLAAPTAQAQVGVSINIGTPAWGPQVPYGTQYYYIPEIDGYYDLYAQQYIVLQDGYWVPLPQLYGYNPYQFHPVVIQYHGREPWLQSSYYHQHYAYQPYRSYYGRPGYGNGYYSNGYGRNGYPRGGGYYGNGYGRSPYNDRDGRGRNNGYGNGGYSNGSNGGYSNGNYNNGGNGSYNNGPRSNQPQPGGGGYGGSPRGGSYGGQVQQASAPQLGGGYGNGQANSSPGNSPGTSGPTNGQDGGRRARD